MNKFYRGKTNNFQKNAHTHTQCKFAFCNHHLLIFSTPPSIVVVVVVEEDTTEPTAASSSSYSGNNKDLGFSIILEIACFNSDIAAVGAWRNLLFSDNDNANNVCWKHWDISGISRFDIPIIIHIQYIYHVAMPIFFYF